MSWVTVVWSMTASACLTLAAVHLSIWIKQRAARANLAFSILAISTAAMAGCELWAMRAGTAGQIVTAIRWTNVPVWAAIASLLLLVRLRLRSGRPWLAWTVFGLRTLALGLNFLAAQNINFREVTGLRHISFFGEHVSVAKGDPNPLMLVSQLGAALLVVFIADAAATAWRRGDRRAALTVGGSLLFFIVASLVTSVLGLWQIAAAPLMNSVFYIGVVAVMGAEVTRGTLKAGELEEELRESEIRFRDIFEGAVEGIFRTSPEGKFLLVNTALATILGYGSAQEAMRSMTDLGTQVWPSPADRARFTDRLAAEGSVRGHEFQATRKDGTRIWVSLSARSMSGPDGKVAYYEGFVSDISLRKRAEQAFRESESRLRDILFGSVEGIYRADLEGRLLVANPALAKILGYDSVEDLLTSVKDVGAQIWPSQEDRARFVRAIDEQGTVLSYECRFKRKDGTFVWVSLSSRSVRRPDGRLDYADGFVKDISERKRAEEALQQNRRLLAEIEKIGKVGGWELDIETMKLTWTAEVFAIHEVDPGFAPTVQEAIEFYAPESRPVIERLVSAAVESGEPYDVELEIITAKGRRRTVHSIGRADPDRRRIYGFFQDITERRQMERELAESDERYRELFEVTPMGLCVVGTDGHVRMANTRQARLYGYDSPRELEGFFAPSFIGEQDCERAARDLEALIDGRDQGERTFTAVRRDGSKFPAEARAVVLRGPSGEAQGFLLLTRDLTTSLEDEREKNQLRFELAHLSRVLTVDAISTSLAHEINQPLGAILNNAEALRTLLARSGGGQGDLPEIVEDILEDTRRAGDIIRKVRKILKKSDARFERLSVNGLIEEALEFLRNNLALNNVELRKDLAPALADIRGDQVRLQQVLLNLATNALEAMTDAPARILTVRSAMDGPDTVTVSVGDSGPGIPENHRNSVFEPFFTTKNNGLGLGLSVCRSIIEEHGGRIFHACGPDGGATFSFTLGSWKDKEALD